jgi:hypothetical protein
MAKSVAEIMQGLIGKGYTPTQVVHSAVRKEAWVRKGTSTKAEQKLWQGVVLEAKAYEAAAYAAAGPGGMACDPHCMGAIEDECVCACGGLNHGIAAVKVA